MPPEPKPGEFVTAKLGSEENAQMPGVEGLPRWSLHEPSFSRHGSAGFCEGLRTP